MKNKIRVLKWIGIAISLMMAMGCAMNLETAHQKAGETGLNNIYATAARVRNPLGQEAIAIEIHAEAKTPPVAYRRETVTTNPTAAAAPQAVAKYVVPATSPRGRKANIVCTPPPKQAPPVAPPTTVMREEGYYPSTIPLATAGGVGAGFLQTWGNALLGNAPLALGMWGAAKVLKPAQTQTNVQQTQTGGGAATGPITNTQSQGQDTNNKLLGVQKTTTITGVDVNATGIGEGIGVGTAVAASN